MASACSVAVATEPKSGGSDFLKTSASTCVLVTVSLICACFLVVCGVLVVREYSLAVAFEETRCRLKNITYSTHDINCIFCAGFKDKHKGDVATASCVPSQFPCVRLMVTYRVGDVTHDAVLHPDSLQASGAYSKCSFSVCKKTREENQKAVDEFVEEWRSRRPEKTFACFYDTKTSGSVIAQKMYSRSDVIHTMLWPSLIVVACAVIFLRMEVKRRRLTFCGRRRSVSEELPVHSYRRGSLSRLEMSPKTAAGAGADKRELQHVLLGSSRGVGGTGHKDGCMAGVSPQGDEALDYRTVLSECGCRFVYKSLPSLNVGKTSVNPNAVQRTEQKGKRTWLHRSVSTDEGYIYDSSGT